jgi:hypothetical protein
MLNNTSRNNPFCCCGFAMMFKMITVNKNMKEVDPIAPPFMNQEMDNNNKTVQADNQMLL